MVSENLKKNLYDLEHNEVLNKLNMFIIIIATFSSGFLFTENSLGDEIGVVSFAIVLAFFINWSHNRKLKGIKEKIKKLY